MGCGRSAAEGCRNDKAGAPPVCKLGAGASGAAAAVGKRRRERDAELQIQAPRLTVRRYEKWGTNIPGRTTVGGRRRTSRSAVARKACVRDAVGRAGGQRRHKRARVGFFHPHPPSVAARRAPAGRKGGPISSASGYFSSLCWSWGRRTRRRRRGAARAAAGREAQAVRGSEGHAQGVKPNCAAWVMIRAGGGLFASPWGSALSERPFRPRRKPRAPVRTWPQRPG